MTNKKRSPKRLTAHEKQVIALVAEGFKSAEIGPAFGRSHWTADQWRRSANAKLGARNPAHLVHLAYKTEVLPFERRALESLLKRIDGNTQS